MKTKNSMSFIFVRANLGKMLFAVLTVLNLASCQKEKLNVANVVVTKNNLKAQSVYPFNWEDPNLNLMPYPNSTINPPWVLYGSLYSNVDPDVLTDRKASDGWTLVISTFDPTIPYPNPFFILYNKYRGLMRIFIYLNNVGSIAASNYLQDGIFSYNYKFLNFAGSDIVDVSNTKYRFDKVEPAPPDGSAPFSPNRWYMLQYEMAYDPQLVPSTASNPPQFSFYVNAINVDSVKLGGTQQGKLNGTIGSSASSTNLFSTIANSLEKPLGSGVLAAIGSNFFENHYDPTLGLGLFGTNNNLGVPNSVYEDVKNGVNSALTSTTSSLPGAITNIFSAIFGGSSASTQQTVSLNLSTTISLKGSISSNSNFIAPISFYMPGSIMTDANGNYNVESYVPLYNQPLGVFNLASKPIVAEISNMSNAVSGSGYVYSNTYSISSLNIQWNPAVTAIATITNLKEEVVLLHPTLYDGLVSSSVNRQESFGGTVAFSHVNSIKLTYQYNDLTNPADEALPVVRISFNVVPNDGGPISAIVKTFAVSVSKTIHDNRNPNNGQGPL